MRVGSAVLGVGYDCVAPLVAKGPPGQVKGVTVPEFNGLRPLRKTILTVGTGIK